MPDTGLGRCLRKFLSGDGTMVDGFQMVRDNGALAETRKFEHLFQPHYDFAANIEASPAGGYDTHLRLML